MTIGTMQHVNVNPCLTCSLCLSFVLTHNHFPTQTRQTCLQEGFSLVRNERTRPFIHPFSTFHSTTQTQIQTSSIRIVAVIHNLGSQLAFGVQSHQVIPAADHRDCDGERMPDVLADDFEIKRPERPYRATGHAAVAGDDGHDAVLDHEARQGRELVRELFFFAPPFWI